MEMLSFKKGQVGEREEKEGEIKIFGDKNKQMRRERVRKIWWIGTVTGTGKIIGNSRGTEEEECRQTVRLEDFKGVKKYGHKDGC